MDAIREIKFLSELHHPNIINLEAVFSTREQNISLVLEHLPLGDLEEMWRKHSIPYTPADIKSWMLMLSQAIWFCHENRVLHRDIKSNNLLIASDGTLKLADFGLARSFADPGRAMTHQVITRYYRPPELLYAARHYSGKVDVWSVGCVFAELVIRNFFVPGDSDINQLSLIYDFGGHPTEETWPGVTSLPSYFPPEKLAKKPQPMMYWRQKFSLIGDSGIDLLRGMLTMDPKKRLSARQVLEHKYWTDAPKPTKVTDLPRRPDEKKMGDDLKRRPGELDNSRADKVARKLDFGSMRK
jgi:cyclin-dependent kinase 7